jgi:hypothetical protein
MLGCCGCERRSPTEPQDQVAVSSPEVVIETISTPQEFHSLLKCNAVVLHIDVDWSPNAILSRRVVAQLKQQMVREKSLRGALLRRIDFTEQKGPLWDALSDWFESQKADRAVMFTGGGALVWVRSGNFADSIHDARKEGVESLVARTHRSFDLQ